MLRDNNKLGIVVGSNPTSGKTLLAIRLGEAAIAAGLPVSVFLVDEGIYCALESTTNKSLLKRFHALTRGGVNIMLCSVMLKSHGVPEQSVKSGIEIGSLLHFVQMINDCDQTLFFMG
ncbi:MAG: DsrE family protein [Sulfuricaulis sp.]